MNDLLEWKNKPVKYLRDQVIEQLKFNLTKGHLEIDEFEELVKLSLSTQSRSELLSLIADLPPREIVTSPPLDLDAYTTKDSVISILSDQKRTGRWIPNKQLKILTVMGAAEIDFSEVVFKEDVTYVSLDCWLGEVKILIPEGINVISNVKTILAAYSHQRERSINPNTPTIVIEGKVVMGEVTIEEKQQSSTDLLTSKFR